MPAATDAEGVELVFWQSIMNSTNPADGSTTKHKLPHTSSFDIESPSDFLYKIVIPQYKDFVSHNSSSRHALLAIMTAYHMYEWVHREKFTEDGFRAVYGDVGGMIETFNVARRITNGTKHFAQTVRTRKQGGFSSEFSDEFARPLIIEFSDGKEQSVDILLRNMVGFWKSRV